MDRREGLLTEVRRDYVFLEEMNVDILNASELYHFFGPGVDAGVGVTGAGLAGVGIGGSLRVLVGFTVIASSGVASGSSSSSLASAHLAFWLSGLSFKTCSK